jgi:hypothetical protein
MMSYLLEGVFGVDSDKTKLKKLREAVKSETKNLEEVLRKAREDEGTQYGT